MASQEIKINESMNLLYFLIKSKPVKTFQKFLQVCLDSFCYLYEKIISVKMINGTCSNVLLTNEKLCITFYRSFKIQDKLKQKNRGALPLAVSIIVNMFFLS